jgi:hypothetical protein
MVHLYCLFSHKKQNINITYFHTTSSHQNVLLFHAAEGRSKTPHFLHYSHEDDCTQVIHVTVLMISISVTEIMIPSLVFMFPKANHPFDMISRSCLRCCSTLPTECHGRVVNASVSYLGGPRFDSQSRQPAVVIEFFVVFLSPLKRMSG